MMPPLVPEATMDLWSLSFPIMVGDIPSCITKGNYLGSISSLDPGILYSLCESWVTSKFSGISMNKPFGDPEVLKIIFCSKTPAFLAAENCLNSSVKSPLPPGV